MTGHLTPDDLGLPEEEVLDVLDLPQLYTRPSATTLLSTLFDLKSQPSSWGSTPRSSNSRSISGTSTPSRRPKKIRNEGVPAYLTKIVSSALQWIEDEQQKEEIWETASQELSARSGRTAQGDLTRSFAISLDNDEVELVLHEPALTADKLGLKTWASSFMLAKRLHSLRDQIDSSAVLELGSGTGLLGMAAACVFSTHVVMTDLPEIVPNLHLNLMANTATIEANNGSADTAIMDWRDPGNFSVNDIDPAAHSFSLVMAADVVYSAEQPALLAGAIGHHLARSSTARVVIELPIRDGFSSELSAMQVEFERLGLAIGQQGEETGYDDWSSGHNDESAEVQCWWTIWRWKDC